MYLLYIILICLSILFSKFFLFFFCGLFPNPYYSYSIAHLHPHCKHFFYFFQKNIYTLLCIIMQVVTRTRAFPAAGSTLHYTTDPPRCQPHFGKNKNKNFFQKTLDKNCGLWYNGKFGSRRPTAGRPK